MEPNSQFASVSLSQERYFSWVFLVDWILTMIALSTTVFYLTRVMGFVLTFILEWTLWKQMKIKVNIESLRISLLSGTIFFKNVCIINQDFTVSFLEGKIVWRFWEIYSRLTEYEMNSPANELGEGDKNANLNYEKNSKLPSIFAFECNGLEAFVYNRKESYDHIIKLFSKEERQQFSSFLNENDLGKLFNEDFETETCEKTFTEPVETSNSDSTAINDRTFNETSKKRKPISTYFLPIDLKFSHGAVTMGNKFTPSLLVASFESGNGILDLCQPKIKTDLYRNRFNMEFQSFEVAVKPNIGYDQEMADKLRFEAGKIARLWRALTKMINKTTRYFFQYYNERKDKTSHDIFLDKWNGISLYKANVNEAGQNGLDDTTYYFASHEYAKTSVLIKSSKLTFTYETDVPGIVPHGTQPTDSPITEPDVGNYGAPPTYLVDIQLSHSSISYGPWANRQVTELIKMLSPFVSRDVKPTQKLVPGMRRIYTVFKVTISVLEDSSWRLPTRESSKDQSFLKQYLETNDDFRPFGWLDMKVCRGTEATFNFSLVPTEAGFDNNLDIHFVDMELRSSVNHDILMKSKEFNIVADVGYPLGWNSEVTWVFDLTSKQLETFLLREHITLVTDIFSDFTSEDPTPYEFFRPYVYVINWEIQGYSIYLNVNDRNVINNPLDFTENCYLSIHGDLLNLDVRIPNTSISQECSDIKYNIFTPMFRLLLNMPPWNTLNDFMKYKEVGRSYDFGVSGSYLLYSDLDIDNVDTIIMDCISKGTTLYCYGFVIRYLMNVQENYFGDFVHYTTSEEYTDILRHNEKMSSTESRSSVDIDDNETRSTFSSEQINQANDDLDKPTIRRSDVIRTENETDIWFNFTVWNGALIMPEELYNSDKCSGLCFNELSISFRSCNYYMDFLTTIYNTSIKRYLNKSPEEIFEYIISRESSSHTTHGRLSDLTVHGHRMYGLPPKELTYFCQWSIDIGDLLIDSDPEFITDFFSSFSKIGFGYSNLENRLLHKMELPDDMTIVTVNVNGITMIVNNTFTDIQARLFIDSLKFSSIDFENERYSARIDIKVPKIQLTIDKIVDSQLTSNLLKLDTQIEFTNFVIKNDYKEHLELQRKFITLHDSPYHRCFFILPTNYQESSIYQELYGGITPSFSLPTLPIPLLSNTIDFIVEDFLKDYSGLIVININRKSSMDSLEDSFIQEENNDTYIKGNNYYQSQMVSKTSQGVDHEYDNYIVNIGHIIIDINPQLGNFIQDIAKELKNESIGDTIDEIEIVIVRRLGTLSKDVLTEMNLKLYVSYLDLHWGVLDSDSANIYLDKLNLEMRQTSFESKKERRLEEMILLSKLGSIRASVVSSGGYGDIDDRPPALSLALEGWEGWSSDSAEQTNSLNILSIDVTIDESQLDWLFEYFQGQINHVNNIQISLKSFQKDKVTLQKNLISTLTTASEFYQIDHDPYVITKPAVIMRLSNGHVRENRSWRIVTRLRHILTYLPPGWQETVGNSKNLKTYKDEKNVFLSVFSNWRNWEVSDVARSYIYRKLFLPEIDERVHPKTTKINVDSFYFTIYSAGYAVDHNFIITRANVVVCQEPKTGNKHSESMDVVERIVNVTGNIGTIKCEFSDQLLKLKDSFLSKYELHMNENVQSPKSLNFYKFNLALLFERLQLQTVIANTRLISRMSNGKISACLENSRDSTRSSGSAVYFASRTEIWLKHKDIVLVETQIGDLFLSGIGESISKCPTILFNAQCTDLHFKAIPETTFLINAIQEMKKEVNYVIEYLKPINTSSTLDKNPSNSNFKNANILLSLNLMNVSSEVTLLSPVTIKHETKNIQFSFNKLGTNDIFLNIVDTDLYLVSYQTKEQYVKFSYDNINFISKTPEDQIKLINLDIGVSLMKLTTLDPRRIVFSYLQDEQLLLQSFECWKQIFPMLSPPKNIPEKETDEMLIWNINIDMKYFGLLIPLNATFFVLEFHSMLSNLTNQSIDRNSTAGSISGNVSLENILVLLKDQNLSNKISKVIDFAMKLSIQQTTFNFERSYEMESSHFRVCLSPESLVQMMWGGHRILTLLDYYKRSTLRKFEKPPELTIGENQNPDKPINISSIHILSYNFCIGWLFQDSGGSLPGLIIGYDRLFSTFEDNYGKITLIDGFFSLANGNTSDSFYSSGNEKGKYNRSYLPNMQILYWIKEIENMKQLFVRFHGETLDVNFLSNFVNIIESSVKSIQTFLMLKRSKILSNARVLKKDDSGTNSNSSNRILSSMQMINCKFIYDGGVFNLYASDGNDIDLNSSLELNSPKVIIDLDYKYLKDSIKSHWIRLYITIEPTFNLLQSRCVPFISEFVESVQSMVKNYSSDDIAQNQKSSTQPIDIKTILDNFDIAFKILSGTQQVCLSCEPKAKVQANIGFKSFSFGIITNSGDPFEPLSCSLSFNDIEASIKHEFSKEPSASFGVNFIDLTLLFSHIKIYGTALFSDVNLFFNIKQFQNLLLFLDIWKLSDVIKIRPKGKKREKEEDLKSLPLSLSKENNFVMPWSFTVIVTNIHGDIHLGPALGVLTLFLQKAWIATDHFENQRQVLHMFSDKLSLMSRGRLGGIIDIANVSWMLDVTYIKEYYIDETPLVDIRLNIENIALKGAFDYHMFLVGTVNNIGFHLESEKDLKNILPDLLTVNLICDEINLCSTALIASNMMDIYNTVMRTKQDNRTSYIETLMESNTIEPKSPISYTEILKSLKLLRTDLSVDIHKLQLQISPISLFDVEVIVITVQDLFARSETQSGEKLMTDLQLKIFNATLSLSKSHDELDEDYLSDISVVEYMKLRSRLSGGNILGIPKLYVGMTTWQKENSNILEYLYTCKFDGKVSVRWNFGPVNFIKEVWATHVRSLAVRRSQVSDEEILSIESDSEVELEEEPAAKFEYVALKEPQIEMPQIKDLEDATPPLEWFGVNRKHFPAATHQAAIVLIQKMVHVAQKEYAKVLGSPN